jgi:DNA-directed RNA polymerase subunit N (RpoN/RPB10)
MIIPIRCFTCGKVVADKYDYYMKEIQKLQSSSSSTQQQQEPVKEKEKGKDKGKEKVEPENPNVYKHFDKLKSGAILDKLQLNRYCCRRMMLGTVDMMDFI